MSNGRRNMLSLKFHIVQVPNVFCGEGIVDYRVTRKSSSLSEWPWLASSGTTVTLPLCILSDILVTGTKLC